MKVGRPTKYSSEIIPKVYEYIKEMEEKQSLPVKEEFAHRVDINGDTLVEWCKIHKKFSAAIKKLEEAQRVMLQKGITSGTFRNPAGGIFLLKNNHGFKDKTETDITSGGKPIPILGGVSVKHVHTNNRNKEDTEVAQED